MNDATLLFGALGVCAVIVSMAVVYILNKLAEGDGGVADWQCSFMEASKRSTHLWTGWIILLVNLMWVGLIALSIAWLISVLWLLFKIADFLLTGR